MARSLTACCWPSRARLLAACRMWTRGVARGAFLHWSPSRSLSGFGVNRSYASHLPLAVPFP